MEAIIITILFLGSGIAAIITILIKRFSRPKQVRATVIDKETYTDNKYQISKMYASEQTDHIVRFQTGEKILHLSVSGLLYDNLRTGEKGTLYYRGGTAMKFVRGK